MAGEVEAENVPRGRSGLDLRLIPVACAVWIGTAASIAWPELFAILGAFAVVLFALGWLWLLKVGSRALARTARIVSAFNAYVALPVVGFLAAIVGVALRKAKVSRHPLHAEVGGVAKTELTLTSAPRATEFGAMAEAKVPRLPGRVWVYGNEKLLALDQGTALDVSVAVKAASRPSIAGLKLTIRGTPEVVATPTDAVFKVRQGMMVASNQLWVGADKLLPAMTLGDERRFTVADQEMMTNAGLSHLTAVSGANVMLVVGAVMACFSWASPRLRVISAGVTLTAFVLVVGTEPSVLRAVLTGAVGLIALVLGRQGQAIPALAGGVVILLLMMPDLAMSVGFMLSVSATAGLVLAAEPLSRRLAAKTMMKSWPAPIVRGVAVAVIAHVVTLPVLAILIGTYSHASIAANLAVAAAVPPVTILGTLAALLIGIGLSPLADVLLWMAAPFAWWVYFVAGVSSRASEVIGPGSGVVSGALNGIALLILWQWPRLMLWTSWAVAALASVMALVVWSFALHIPRAPSHWIAAVCSIDGRVVVIDSPVVPPIARESRPCRVALSLDDANLSAAIVSSSKSAVYADNDAVETVIVPSPSYIEPSAIERNVNERDVAEQNVIEQDSTERDVAERNGTLSVGVDGDVEKREQKGTVKWIVAKECGERIRREVMTPEGVPVVCPDRDGPQVLLTDGSVWRGW